MIVTGSTRGGRSGSPSRAQLSDPDLGVGQEPLVLKSEFAAVRVSLDLLGNGPRLLVRDLRNGNEVYLDAFTLSCLAGAKRDVFLGLADPANTQWGGTDQPASPGPT